MRNRDEPIEALLLDYQLGRLDEAARRELDERLGEDPALAAKLERLAAVLEPLDTWAAPPPPSRLVSIILDRIERQAYPRLAPSPDLPAAERRPAGRRPMISLREVAALAACIVFFFGVFVPSVSRARSLSRRTLCGNNLASIFGGMQSYAAANAGVMPNVGMRRGVNWLETSPNRANFRPLVRSGHVATAKVFVCPSRKDHCAMCASGPADCRSFPGRRHCSYDLQNMAGPTVMITARICLPVVSDANPLFEGGRFNDELDPYTANSKSHRGRGQNVLRFDGHVFFAPSPNVGERSDNIWTMRNVRVYRGTEVQQAATDSFLVP